MGTLYLVATPIGNLEDITLRALRVLREVQLIAAEDTRHTRKLLTHFSITTPLMSYHEHSHQARRDTLLAALSQGDVALVSDAGTPVISDPGQDLVREALATGFPVVPIPGAVAAISAVIASGLPTDTFTFLGFLPRKSAERRAMLESVRAEPRTLILYEAPHRLLALLDDVLAVLGDRQIVAAREVTKVHEEWLRGPISSIRAHYTTHTPRGEYTLVIAGADASQADAAQQSEQQDSRPVEEIARERLQALLELGLGTREAASQVAQSMGQPKRQMYHLALGLVEQDRKG